MVKIIIKKKGSIEIWIEAEEIEEKKLKSMLDYVQAKNENM